MQPPVVLLGANFYTALGAIRTLGRRGVPVFALDYHFPTAYALASRYVTKKIKCPDINRDEKGLAEFLINLARQFDEPPVLMATADSYALMISRYAEELRPYYRFPAMPHDLLEKIIDKKGLSELANEKGLLMPQTFISGDGADIDNIAKLVHYPCIVKPALSHEFVKIFRQKCLYANNREELHEALVKAKENHLEVMVQEIIPGFDDQMYVFDTYVNEYGEATYVFTAQKLRQFPINFGSSTLTHHVYEPELIKLGLDYMKKIGYRGYGEIEFKRNPRDNRYYMIEINARLSTLNILFDKCGVEFTYIMYRDLIGQPLAGNSPEEEKPWAFWHAYEDIISSLAYMKSGQLTLWQILQPWIRHKKAHAIWALDDPLPLFAFSRLIAVKIFRKLKS